MVKRFVIFLFIFVLLLYLFVFPCFAVDTILTDSNIFGFAYDDSRIFSFNGSLVGNLLNVNQQIFTVNQIYLYIPAFSPCNSLTCNFSFCLLGGSITASACDYGYIYSNSYHYSSSLPVVQYRWVGTASSVGSSNKVLSCQVSFSDLPFTDFDSMRYIRYTLDCSSEPVSFVCWQNRSLNDPSYSFSGVESSSNGRTTSGSLISNGYYLTGSVKDKYYNGSSVVSETRYLNSGTSGSAGYLYVPSHTLGTDSSHQLSFSVDSHSLSGTISPSSSSSNVDRTYLSTVSANIVRSFDDSDLISAVNSASNRNHSDITTFSDRNHSDLQAISSQLGELVDHQNQVNQTGDDIGSTTSDSSISDTSGSLSSGSDGLSGVLSTASDISSVSGAAAPYISFIGAAMPIILNFGNGVLAWAVVGIIACSVFLWILKKVAE